MKTITANTGKTCKPHHIPNSEKMTTDQLQDAYEEIADGYEKWVWFDQYILGGARQKAANLKLNVRTRVMDAEKLEFADRSFDTVTSTLSTCTFSDPFQALKEMQRVCRPDGLILLLEHGHSSMSWLAKHQDRHVLQHYQQNAGCRWNQDPLDLVRTPGLKFLDSKLFDAIMATP